MCVEEEENEIEKRSDLRRREVRLYIPALVCGLDKCGARRVEWGEGEEEVKVEERGKGEHRGRVGEGHTYRDW
jgi:hypothetical protein